MLPGSGCRGRQGAIQLPAGMEQGFAVLLPVHAQSLASHKGRMWRGLHSAFLKYLGVNASLWSRSQQQFTPCTHIVPNIFPGRWQTVHPCTWPLPRNAQVSPSPGICRGDPADLSAPSALERASPAAHAPHRECLGCAGGGRGRGSADTLAGKAI